MSAAGGARQPSHVTQPIYTAIALPQILLHLFAQTFPVVQVTHRSTNLLERLQ